MVSFTLKQDDTNYFRLSVLSKRFLRAWDTWDGNLLCTQIEYAISGSVDSYEAVLFSTDLESFRDELTGDVVDETGIIALTTIDGVVSIEMERVGDDLIADCSLSKVPDGVEDARLNLTISVAAAAQVVAELDTILLHYPVIGPGHETEPGELRPPSRN